MGKHEETIEELKQEIEQQKSDMYAKDLEIKEL